MHPRSVVAVLVASVLTMGSIHASTAAPSPVVSHTFELPAEADFAENSFVLEPQARQRFATVGALIKSVNVEVVVIKGFAPEGRTDTGEALALERARSVKALLTLNGIAPERVYVEARDAGAGRPGRVEVEVVAQRKR